MPFARSDAFPSPFVVMKPSPLHCDGRRAFSLVELLAVICVMAIVTAASGPVMQALKASGGVNQAIAQSSGLLEYARAYAMSGHTYVRVGIGQAAATGIFSTPATVLVVIYSVDGTLDADSTAAMADPAQWAALTKPVILNNLTVNTNLTVEMSLNSSSYASPDQTDIPSPVSFKAGDRGPVSCSSFIQFNPDGGSCVVRSEPARFIDLALDRPAPQNGRNPFVVRLSGLNGNISILRKGAGIP